MFYRTCIKGMAEMERYYRNYVLNFAHSGFK